MQYISYKLAILLCICLFFVYGTIQHAILLIIPLFLIPYVIYVYCVATASFQWLKGDLIPSKRAKQIEYVCAYLLSNYIIFNLVGGSEGGIIKSFIFMPCLIFGFYLSRKCRDQSSMEYSLANKIPLPFFNLSKPYKIIISVIVWASIVNSLGFSNISLSSFDAKIFINNLNLKIEIILLYALFFISSITFLMLNIAWVNNKTPKKIYMQLIRIIGLFFLSVFSVLYIMTFGAIAILSTKYIIYMFAVLYLYVWHRQRELNKKYGSQKDETTPSSEKVEQICEKEN